MVEYVANLLIKDEPLNFDPRAVVSVENIPLSVWISVWKKTMEPAGFFPCILALHYSENLVGIEIESKPFMRRSRFYVNYNDSMGLETCISLINSERFEGY